MVIIVSGNIFLRQLFFDQLATKLNSAIAVCKPAAEEQLSYIAETRREWAIETRRSPFVNPARTVLKNNK